MRELKFRVLAGNTSLTRPRFLILVSCLKALKLSLIYYLYLQLVNIPKILRWPTINNRHIHNKDVKIEKKNHLVGKVGKVGQLGQVGGG